MRSKISVLFLLLTSMFCVFLILANLMEVKVVRFGVFTATAGLAVFPISYIINDCIVEVYGFRKARLVIWLGFLMNFIFVMFLQLAIVLPSDPSWTHQEAIDTIFGNTPRILLGSFVAFICGSMVNAYVMSKMKVISNGKMFSLRAVLSTLFGETVDSFIFFPVAFLGVLPLSTIISLIWTQALLKTIYEIIVLPVTIKVVKEIKRHEDLDTFDKNIDYKWWRIDQI
ncbi:MAG: queuosine precursor transporter [Muribaculaceae bacterium]|nr:queuosine precursor transporter [Muribaculaceae bacterium]